MIKSYSNLVDGLHAGFVDNSLKALPDYLPELLTNDRSSGLKVLSKLQNELRDCDEFWFSVAFVTTGGVATIIETLRELEKKGIEGKVLVSQYLNFTQPEALKRLIQFKNISTRIITYGDFHAKGYIFRKNDEYKLIIGSSNLTDTALSTNKEWNLKVTATKHSVIVNSILKNFNKEYENAIKVNANYISAYSTLYKQLRKRFIQSEIDTVIEETIDIVPNRMQKEALLNLELLRKSGEKSALLISATGTGKTYLSAFDVKAANPKKVLFVVHRENIAKAALESFKRIIGSSKTMGMFSGSEKNPDADFVFSMIQTISKDDNLIKFTPEQFDYIIIDETHRSGAESYQKINNYFKPKFLLGMTATPERTDGFNIFKQFNHKIAYEIRLHRALEEEMLSTFHYYGISDLSINGRLVEEDAAFKYLVAEERVDRIIEKANFYGTDSGVLRGLIFCSQVEEANELAYLFNKRGYKTIALTGSNSELEREQAIQRLESDNESEKLDYIFTVDIFNEGVDIPKVNQIIMLRPTQSSIVFIQQLGRGLRKAKNKKYLTVIDFIGNYSNNYMIPIALYGDSSYNKDKLRKLVSSGSQLIPGASTINFDEITKEKIYASINSAKLNKKRDLDRDYDLLEFELGRPPMMMDFIEHGSRDPYTYVEYSKSYFSYVATRITNLNRKLTPKDCRLLELLSSNVLDGKRIEEVILLKELLDKQTISLSYFESIIKDKLAQVSIETIESCINGINLSFATSSTWENVSISNDTITFGSDLNNAIDNIVFKQYFIDALNLAEFTLNKRSESARYINGFFLYEKYTRKDVLRILNWEKNVVPQNIGGYIVKSDKTVMPVFVTYEKSEHIADTIKYEDEFVSKSEFVMISKSKRYLTSPEIVLMKTSKDLRIPLFVKKSDDEGFGFYYLGDMKPKPDGFSEGKMGMEGNQVNIVKIRFELDIPVEDNLFTYLTNMFFD